MNALKLILNTITSWAESLTALALIAVLVVVPCWYFGKGFYLITRGIYHIILSLIDKI